jgi:hypothetical protein
MGKVKAVFVLKSFQAFLQFFALKRDYFAAIHTGEVMVVRRKFLAEFDPAFEAGPDTVDYPRGLKQINCAVNADLVHIVEGFREFGHGQGLAGLMQKIKNTQPGFRNAIAFFFKQLF